LCILSLWQKRPEALRRRHPTEAELREFLDIRFAWINAQLQTIFLFLLSLVFSFLFAADNTVLTTWVWRLFAITYSIFVSVATLKQCHTLWTIEVQLVDE
jgi:hypothetical protein